MSKAKDAVSGEMVNEEGMVGPRRSMVEILKTAANVSYVPHVLRTMREICHQMGVGERTVRQWVKDGAPIAVEGKYAKHTRYSAEKMRLQLWRELTNTPNQLIGGARAGADGASAE